jgi:hypothetical protein
LCCARKFVEFASLQQQLSVALGLVVVVGSPLILRDVEALDLEFALVEVAVAVVHRRLATTQ